MPNPLIGINGTARRSTGAYVGVDGVARKIVKAYVGVNDIARLCWSNETIEVPDDMFIDFIYEVKEDRVVLTGWKETYLGQASTKLIIPETDIIVEI